MRLIHVFALISAVLGSLVTVTAMAGEPVHLTPPLYREQARTVQQTRQASELTTTPQIVAAAKPVET